jgi:hypothetical protein
MVLPGAKRLARIELLKRSLTQGSRAVPAVGSVASYLVEEVLDHRKRRLKREALLLTEPEQDLLFVVQATADNKRLLLTADHVELWDDASWSLLAMVLSERLDELYPALKHAVFVIGASREVPTKLRPMLVHHTPQELRIRLFDLDQMPTVLSTFGFPKLTLSRTRVLFEITNGRLDLLHDIGNHLQRTDLLENPGSWLDFYSSLIRRRIEDLREHVKDLEETLTAAAVIGRSFTTNDIACLVGSATDCVATTLRVASEEHLITEVGGMAQFDSTELHEYFHRNGSGEHARYHAKFADCLRIMRPGDYEHRLHHLVLAGNTEAAQACYALAALSARRECRAAPDPAEIRAAAGWLEIRRFLDGMLKAYDAYDDQRLAEGLAFVEGIETFLPEVLVAEKDYLEALLLLATPSISSYDRARLLLQRWKVLAGREGELWGRLAQSLIVALAQTGHLDEARQLEADLTSEYWARRQVDPWALNALNVLRRRAECLHSLPTATQRLESALAYFGPSNGRSVPRNPIQYYYTLTNVIGNKLASGRFEEAHNQAVALERLIELHPSLSWPSPEIAANNSILARYLAGFLDPATAADLLSTVAKGSAESGDRLLLQSNCAVLAVRVGRAEEARSTLEAALGSILRGEDPDGYHRYFVSNNLAALVALHGDLPRAFELIEGCAALVDQFYPAVRETMIRRQSLIKEALSAATRLTCEEFDDWLIKQHGMQVGPQWAFYGRGFLLTDIQFWSAD